MLAQNKKGDTFSHVATRMDHFDVLEKMWAWVKEEQRNSIGVKKVLLLSTDLHGDTSFHLVAENSRLEALEILWIWAKEVELNTDELLLIENWI